MNGSNRALPAGLAVLIILLTISLASAAKCPYTGAQTPTDYSDVRTSPTERYVGKEITFTITDVWADGSKTVAANRLVIIYYIINEEIASESNIYTDSSGKARFTPEDSGRYAVATSHRYLFFDVLAKCGDDRCTFGETRISCPDDCAKCGDGTCDVGETKETCPKDCIICGDDSCDSGENRGNCPGDCARCGDGVCDINENKVGCPDDCVVCGDGTCDYLELVSLHNTTCPEDCSLCGDGYCDLPENASSCPEDCMTCGNNICEGNENSTCPQDCNICGDDKCDYDENKTTCPIDCAVCGDSVCDPFEITGLHKTSCVKDCATCGDGYCDSGESSSCDTDCRDKIQGVFMGYLIIPLIIAILLIIFEITRHYATHGRQKAAEAKEAAQTLKDAARKTKLKRMEPGEIMPYLLLFSAGLAVTTILLAFLGISYEKNLAILDLGNYLINNGPIISLIILALAAGIGMLARATYYMERNQAISLSLIFAVLGLVPGLLIFLNLEYMVLMAGLIVGTLAATITIKKDEVEYAVKKPFKMGSEAADKMLTIAAVFACILILLQLYTDSKTSDKLSSAIWQSQTTKAMVKDSFGPQENEKALRDNVVEPFFNSTMGGVNGQLVFAIGAAILLLVILKVFITVIKLLAGFFAWLLDKSGFVK